MAIEYKVIERANPQDRSKKKYYASANITGRTTLLQLCREIEHMSALSGAEVQGVLYALAEVLPRHLGDGKSVHLGDLGSFRISMGSVGEDSEDDVDVNSIKRARIVFTPSRELTNLTKGLRYKKIT